MAGVYISYPFCNQKCSFCNFASGVSSADVRSRYAPALLREIRSHHWEWNPETIYFGGGTPSLMDEQLLSEIMAAIPQSSVVENTLECAPGTITRERIGAWKRNGINRVSLGVQSFVIGELRATGRRHTAEIVQSDIALLREATIENINVDLIAGLPDQTAESWEQSLDWMERLNPPHVSVYIFEIDEDSRLGKEVLDGGARYGAGRLPDEDRTTEFYERAAERLAGLGIQRYEISNSARPGWESRHNLKYWQLEPYVGFGSDAHSFDGKLRWSNPDTLAGYLDGRELSKDATQVDAGEEHFFVGLRLSAGIEPTPAEWVRFAKPIEKWLGEGFLQRAENRLRLSGRGVLVSNEIFQEFLNV